MPGIGFAGMTHLGLVSAAACASKGFNTRCYDPDAELIERLKRGEWESVLHEPGFAELITSAHEFVSFTSDVRDLDKCDLVYISRDTDIDDEGRADTSGVGAIARAVAPYLARSAPLIILSQVPPGFTRGLARTLGLFPSRVYCQVETLVFGNAVERACNPERLIIGCAHPGDEIKGAFGRVLAAFDCPVMRMGYESAELAKIAINVHLAASITATNVLAEIASSCGADWGEIAPALRLDRRIGPHAYLRPGLGIGGGHLARDLVTLVGLADNNAVEADVIGAMLRDSAYRRDWPLSVLHAEVTLSDSVIGILGVTYKENTRSIRDSPSVELIRQLGEREAHVRVFDPVREAPAQLNLVNVEDMESVARGADALVIMTPWMEFRTLDVERCAREMRGSLIIDPFGVLNHERCHDAGLRHFVLGRPEDE
jgi:UDPglucose 6-dehydrogenase